LGRGGGENVQAMRERGGDMGACVGGMQELEGGNGGELADGVQQGTRRGRRRGGVDEGGGGGEGRGVERGINE